MTQQIQDRGKMIPGDWLSPEYLKAFSEACVEALLKQGNEDRQELQKYARENFSLDGLAKDWEQMFHRLIKEVKDNPLQRYQPVAA